MSRPAVALVGGFLGAGKTTLILKAARILQSRGVAVAAVLNDQGDELVDTEFARRNGVPAGQVSGGCFCCRLPDLVESLDRLAENNPQIIFAEAVGSCVDLIATTIRPLLRDHGARFRVAPLTVLVHEEPTQPDLKFIFDRQVSEADMVIHRDLDIAAWLDTLMNPAIESGTKSLEVDYTRYAEAEAALGWLNVRALIRCDPMLSPAMVLGPLLDDIDRALAAAGISIVHLKAIDQCDAGYVKAALTCNGQEPAVEGMLDASPDADHDLLLNLRALGAPEQIRPIVERALAAATTVHSQAFRPAPPVPFLRIT